MLHLEKIGKILAVDDTVCYVAVVDSKGNIIASKIKENVTDIGENEEEMYRTDLCITKQMLDIFDSSFGKTISLYTTREKTRQLIYYHDDLIIYVTCTPDADEKKMAEISGTVGRLVREEIVAC